MVVSDQGVPFGILYVTRYEVSSFICQRIVSNSKDNLVFMLELLVESCSRPEACVKAHSGKPCVRQFESSILCCGSVRYSASARLSDLIPYFASRYCQQKNETKTTSMHRVRHCRLVLVCWIKIMFMHSVSDTFKCSHPSALPHHRLNRSAQ